MSSSRENARNILHDYVGSEIVLDLYRLLGCEKVLGAVKVGTEVDSFLDDVLGTGEREDLESAAVGQYSAFPVHELVKSAGFGDKFASRSHPQVICVREDYPRTHRRDLVRTHALNRCLRAYGHESWSIKGAVRRVNSAESGAGLLTCVDMFVPYGKFAHKSVSLVIDYHWRRCRSL